MSARYQNLICHFSKNLFEKNLNFKWHNNYLNKDFSNYILKNFDAI